jgi:antitoxin (DNA-binding transcriptional repressor) of toxin-antitoxin stability system
MITVGVRELKAQLSYYLKLMQEGEEIAIRMRDQVIGYLSNVQHELKKKSAKKQTRRDLQKLMDEWKKSGFIISGGKVGVKWPRHTPAKMTPGISTTEIIRKMRDEEEDWL